MRTKTKTLTCLLCILVLLMSMVTPAFAAKDGALPRKEEATLLDQILKRDGFLDGIWYPWLFNGQGSVVSRIIFTVVGLAGLWCISLLFRSRNEAAHSTHRDQ